MANENKTQKTNQSVEVFLNAIADSQQQADAKVLSALMEEITGKKPYMYGSSIVGFGSYHYKYESGREGDAPAIGFSPRKQNLVLYIVEGYEDYGPLLEKLGKHSIGKSCLYIKRLSDIDLGVLKEMIQRSVASVKAHFPTDLQ